MMPDETEFTVLRAHWGYKRARTGEVRRYRYKPGQTRLADPAEVVDAVRFGVLAPLTAPVTPDAAG